MYQPLLSAIKREYEEALEEQARQLQLMYTIVIVRYICLLLLCSQPMHSRLATIRAETDHTMKQLQLQHEAELQELKCGSEVYH